MISGSTMCASFKVDLLYGRHNFSTGQFMIALYTSIAPIGVNTTAYVTAGEVVGPGYTAGGLLLTNAQILGPSGTGNAAYVTFADAHWPNSSLIARGALIYNQSSAQRAVAVIDFVTDYASNNGDFWVQFPPAGPSTALIQLQ